MEHIQYQVTSMLGALYLTASDAGLTGVYFERQPMPVVKRFKAESVAKQVLLEAAQQLDEYFKGTRKRFDLRLRMSGTDFQQQVWRELLKIPYGRTVSYRDIARRIENPKAVRAVGGANGRNPFCIIVPCHRVIASDGTIGGYSGGLGIKRRLLKLEGVSCDKNL